MANVTGNTPEIYLRDLQTGTTSLVSVNLAGAPAARSAYQPSISAATIWLGSSSMLDIGPACNGRPGAEPRWNHQDRSARPVRCSAGLSRTPSAEQLRSEVDVLHGAYLGKARAPAQPVLR